MTQKKYLPVRVGILISGNTLGLRSRYHGLKQKSVNVNISKGTIFSFIRRKPVKHIYFSAKEDQMELAGESGHDYKPLKLLPNKSYPTYQLYAAAGGNSAQPDDVLKIAVLETMGWLRQRFKALELPPELDKPGPELYSEFELSGLRSFFLDLGYKLEVIWLPEEKIWTMQLTEPDLGSRPDAREQKRKPVPGRLFETNVSYRIIRGEVECGFKTVVSEPEGTKEPCEVYRLAFIKNLARSGLIELKQTWSIRDSAHRLLDQDEIKRFCKWIEDSCRMMPAVVFAERGPETPSVNILSFPKVPFFIERSDRPYMRNRPPKIPPAKKTADPALPLDISALARYRMGYAQFFVLPAEQRDAFNGAAGAGIENGGVMIFEPAAFGGKITGYPHSEIVRDPGAFKERLDRFAQDYPKGKAMTFGDCVFVPSAKGLEQKRISDLLRTKEEVAAYYSGLLEKAEEDRRKSQIYLQRELNEKEKQILRLNEELASAEKKKDEIQNRLKEAESGRVKIRGEKEELVRHFRSLQDRPKRPGEVSEWVERTFAGRLIFHEKAKNRMESVKPEKVNLPLLCDALEYLAAEYRDELLGSISVKERDDICSEKYNRPFTVEPVKGFAPDTFPEEYKIKYNIGFKGKRVETPLDLHLKVGKDKENLLRIYFLYDKEKKLIVVGSLPEHLSTLSYQ
jgi:predicted transcriptional regulator